MSLCSCDFDGESWVDPAEDFAPLETKRSRKCVSCENRIVVGELSLHFFSYRAPRCEYEDRRFGDGVRTADLYMCERCGEIYLNLSAAGLCISVGRDMEEALQEYQQMTGFNPKAYQQEKST